jgi:hypothetical protein
MYLQLDPERLRLNPKPLTLALAQTRKLPRHKRNEKFLKGPIPWAWLIAAASLPGKALHVGIHLWFWAGIKRNRTVRWSVSGIAAMGVTRSSAHRGLVGLEGAGLVSVVRHAGRKPLVTILEVLGSSSDSQ